MSERRSIPIARPALGQEEWEALREPIESGWLTQGPKVAEFERAFAARHGAAHGVATTSCTTALHLALAAAGVGPGDHVVVPAFTWVATANAAVFCGAEPIFADVDEATYNVTAASVAAVLTERTRAVVPVHMFGLCAPVDEIRAVVGSEVFILEDAACAAGATRNGRPAGALGDAAAFSFHPRKSITTGEGGMITTADTALADTARRLRNHGAALAEEDRHASSAPYLLPRFGEVGFNFRMTDLQAAIGLVQLKRLDDFVAERARWAAWYRENLADLPWLLLPEVPHGHGHGWQSYVARITSEAPAGRDALLGQLHERGIAARPGTHCVPCLEAYRMRGYTPETCPVAAALELDTFALPLHNRMSADDYAYVADVLHAL